MRRDSDWNSNSWANIKNGNAKAVNKEDDWGYSIGGPIGKPGGATSCSSSSARNGGRAPTAGALNRFRFPTALERAGDFSQTRDNNGDIYNLIRDASTNLPCTATNTAGCFQDGGVVGRIPPSRLYQTGLNILKQYPMPNLPGTAGLAYNYEAPAPKVSTLNNQPAVRLDYQPIQPLRAIFRYAAERQRQETFPGSIPGFNDVQTQNPIIATIAAERELHNQPDDVPGSDLRPNPERAGRLHDAQRRLRQRRPDGSTLEQEQRRTGRSAADLPRRPRDGLRATTSTRRSNGWRRRSGRTSRSCCRRRSRGATAIGNAPPNIAYPGVAEPQPDDQDVAVSLTKVWGRHTLKTGYYNHYSFKAQNRGTGGLNFGGPGAMNFGKNTSNPIDSSFGFSNAALGIINSYTQMSRFMEGSFVYNNREAYIQDNWKVTSRLTLDYGDAVRPSAAAVRRARPVGELPAGEVEPVAGADAVRCGLRQRRLPLLGHQPPGDEPADRPVPRAAVGAVHRPARARHRQSDQRHLPRRARASWRRRTNGRRSRWRHGSDSPTTSAAIRN